MRRNNFSVVVEMTILSSKGPDDYWVPQLTLALADIRNRLATYAPMGISISFEINVRGNFSDKEKATFTVDLTNKGYNPTSLDSYNYFIKYLSGDIEDTLNDKFNAVKDIQINVSVIGVA